MFVNRVKEISKLKSTKGPLIVVVGRRRVGKTSLIKKVFAGSGDRAFFYTQAIDGAELTQISQFKDDVLPLLPDVTIQSWSDLFKLIPKDSTGLLVIDEFPYLVKTQPSLPSILQKFFDHHIPSGLTIVLSGSSQTMMHDIFLTASSPLYERASEIIRLQPMNYRSFCQYMHLSSQQIDSYILYSLVGGVPKYWQYLTKGDSLIQNADRLYFEAGSHLEFEPEKLLKDENITGSQGKAILEIIGRGAHRPSEIAQKMGIKQTSLGSPLQLLRDASLVTRHTPFGESERSSKKNLYKLNDHCLAFWYGVYSPHRSRWSNYREETKLKLLKDHASRMIELDFRHSYPHSASYWESSIEFDCVRFEHAEEKKIIVSELKLRNLTAEEKLQLESSTKDAFNSSKLSLSYSAKFEALGLRDLLAHLAS